MRHQSRVSLKTLHATIQVGLSKTSLHGIKPVVVRCYVLYCPVYRESLPLGGLGGAQREIMGQFRSRRRAVRTHSSSNFLETSRATESRCPPVLLFHRISFRQSSVPRCRSAPVVVHAAFSLVSWLGPAGNSGRQTGSRSAAIFTRTRRIKEAATPVIIDLTCMIHHCRLRLSVVPLEGGGGDSGRIHY